MRKEYVIPASVVILLIAVMGLIYYFPTGDDVRIARLEAPEHLMLRESGELTVTLRNNAIIPVNVSVDVENAFLHKNGTSSRVIIGPENPDGTLTLLPGNNTYKFFLGYLVTGRHNVRVKVYQHGQLIDKDSVYVTVPVPQRPGLSVQLSYRKEISDSGDIYNIYGYLIDDQTIAAGTEGYEIPVQITIIDDGSGEVISDRTEDYDLKVRETKSLSRWKGRPMAVIELAHAIPSSETYMPVESVAKGKTGDTYLVKVTATWNDPWYDQRYEMYGKPVPPQQVVVYDELVIPPE